MVLVRRLRGRGAHGVVEIHGEALFAPGADIPRWQNRFSQRVRAAAALAAPTHNYGERPLRPHPGKPLKNTFVASTTKRRLTKGGGFVYSAVGSTANYSAYVDQGTGVFVGNNPWKAKVLPPYSQGSPSLYEHTWIPAPGGKRVAPVFIRGQKGKFFMDEALLRGFQSMRMRSYQVPGEGVSGLVANTLATAVPAFPGNTEADAAFRQRLDEWRAWRDEAWNRKHRALGEKGALSRQARRLVAQETQRRADQQSRKEQRARESKERRAEANRKYQRARRKRDNITESYRKKYETKSLAKLTSQRESDIRDWLISNLSKKGYIDITSVFVNPDGTWFATVRKSMFDPWVVAEGRWG